MNTRNLLLTFSLAAGIAGCAKDTKYDYSVVVDNQSDRAVTVWLTTNRPINNTQWMSPEEVAIISPSIAMPANRVVIPPGGTGSTGPIKGKFPPNVEAVLRIYVGERSFDELLAMSRGNPNRVDLRLPVGANPVTISQQGGRIVAQRGVPATAPAN
jgi:hypothetical protein